MDILMELLHISGDLDAHEVLTNYDCALVEFIRHWRQEVFDRAGGSSDVLLPVGIIQVCSSLTYCLPTGCTLWQNFITYDNNNVKIIARYR